MKIRPARYQLIGKFAESTLSRGTTNISVNAKNPGQDAKDVAVEDGYFLAECDGSYRRGGVFADACEVL
jgi:hypothetical protein